MAIFFTITLVISIVGMALLLWLKHYELKTGRVFFVGVRPRLGYLSRHTLMWFERVLPGLVSRLVRQGYRWVRMNLHAAAAWVVIGVERLLEQTLKGLRHKTNPRPHGGEASAFLREVAEHKKKLLEDKEDK